MRPSEYTRHYPRQACPSSCAGSASPCRNGLDWYWPSEEDPEHSAPSDAVRLLAPFDPVVWDRTRFELLWGWVYRFEAYTPPPNGATA
jgi:uncharacterized protein